MELAFWWMLIIWLVGIASYYLVLNYYQKNLKIKNDKQSSAILIAHSERLKKLPEYKKALISYRFLVRLPLAAMTLAAIAGILLTSRPQTVSTITPTQGNQDIMLCLDVSGSMLNKDALLLYEFNIISQHFPGQQFGVTLFNSSAYNPISLTNDYSYLRSNLANITYAFSTQKGQEFNSLTSGTLAGSSQGTSLVGDGLTGCINNLGSNPLEHSQSILLVTDNQGHGQSIISQSQATNLAVQRNVKIYTINIRNGALSSSDAGLKKISYETTGEYYVFDQSQTSSSVISSIKKQPVHYSPSLAVNSSMDSPTFLAYISLFSVSLAIVLLWRLRL